MREPCRPFPTPTAPQPLSLPPLPSSSPHLPTLLFLCQGPLLNLGCHVAFGAALEDTPISPSQTSLSFLLVSQSSSQIRIISTWFPLSSFLDSPILAPGSPISTQVPSSTLAWTLPSSVPLCPGMFHRYLISEPKSLPIQGCPLPGHTSLPGTLLSGLWTICLLWLPWPLRAQRKLGDCFGQR